MNIALIRGGQGLGASNSGEDPMLHFAVEISSARR